jgi:hypothetical protein
VRRGGFDLDAAAVRPERPERPGCPERPGAQLDPPTPNRLSPPMRPALLLLAAVALACAPKPVGTQSPASTPSPAGTTSPAGASTTYALADLHDPLARVSWANHTVVNGVEDSLEPNTETCTLAQVPQGLAAPSGGEVFQCVTEAASWNSRGLYILGPDGWGHFASQYMDRGWQGYEAKIELPSLVSVGDIWSGSHGAGEDFNLRECQALPSVYCSAGLATECVTRKANTVVFLRQHYCAGVGWVGHEAMVVRSDDFAMEDWSAQVSIEGVAVPYAERAVRPLPTARKLRKLLLHPADLP